MFERVLNALLWCQEFIPSSSNNELIMYPLNFKLSRTWLHKSCIVFKTTCDYWGKLIELALHMLYESAVNYTTPNEGYNGNVALQMLYESGVETCGTTNDKAILELRDKCNWLNSEI